MKAIRGSRATARRCLLGLSLALAPVAASVGCSVDAGVAVTRTGFLTVQWSIAGTFSPAACADFAVDVVEIVITDVGGTVVARRNPICEDHAATFELVPGTYYVDVTMLAPGGAARTTTLQLPATDVFSDQTATLDTDFPASSFF